MAVTDRIVWMPHARNGSSGWSYDRKEKGAAMLLAKMITRQFSILQADRRSLIRQGYHLQRGNLFRSLQLNLRRDLTSRVIATCKDSVGRNADQERNADNAKSSINHECSSPPLFQTAADPTERIVADATATRRPARRTSGTSSRRRR